MIFKGHGLKNCGVFRNRSDFYMSHMTYLSQLRNEISCWLILIYIHCHGFWWRASTCHIQTSVALHDPLCPNVGLPIWPFSPSPIELHALHGLTESLVLSNIKILLSWPLSMSFTSLLSNIFITVFISCCICINFIEYQRLFQGKKVNGWALATID